MQVIKCRIICSIFVRTYKKQCDRNEMERFFVDARIFVHYDDVKEKMLK